MISYCQGWSTEHIIKCQIILGEKPLFLLIKINTGMPSFLLLSWSGRALSLLELSWSRRTIRISLLSLIVWILFTDLPAKTHLHVHFLIIMYDFLHHIIGHDLQQCMLIYMLSVGFLLKYWHFHKTTACVLFAQLIYSLFVSEFLRVFCSC